VTAFEKLGAKPVHYLPFAADTDLHRPVGSGGAAAIGQHDVAFIGTWRPEREAVLEQLVEFDLCVWGSKYWKTRTRAGSPLRSRWAGRSIAASEFAQACANSRVLLNILDSPTWPGPNMRTFEQPACAAFSLETRSPAVLELFTEGKDIECFDSIGEARDKARYYLDHDSERKRIAEASYHFVVHTGHTYLDRVRQLLRWMAEDSSAAATLWSSPLTLTASGTTAPRINHGKSEPPV
jgi:spore maturation protein CgeB